jgi:hypothetical protein
MDRLTTEATMPQPVLRELTLGYRDFAPEDQKKFLLILGLIGEAGGCGKQGRKLQIRLIAGDDEGSEGQV